MAKARQPAAARPQRLRNAGKPLKVERVERAAAHVAKSAVKASRGQACPRAQGCARGARGRRSSMPRSRCSPSTASRRPGSTTWRPAPASPRARSISTSRTRRRCSRRWCATPSRRCWSRSARSPAAPNLPPAKALETFFALFEKEVLGTDRKLLLRLIIAEGPRFPAHRRVLLPRGRLARAWPDARRSRAARRRERRVRQRCAPRASPS